MRRISEEFREEYYFAVTVVGFRSALSEASFLLQTYSFKPLRF